MVRQLGVRAALIALFTTLLTAIVGFAGSGTALACAPGETRSDAFAATLPQVQPGQQGPIVLALQLNLRQRGYQLNGTGTYADNTLAAVRDFQRKNGINDSGIVGSKTWHSLVGSLSQRVTGNGQTLPPNVQVLPGAPDQESVFLLKNALQRVHPYFGKVTEGGGYDPVTQGLVQDFQRRAGINASGIVGPKTWSALYLVVSVSGQWGC